MNVFEKIRKEYETRGLQQSELNQDPLEQFDRWFKEAVEHSPGDWLEANAMTLSTSAANIVTSRTVLLKDYSHGRFVFFTNYDSEKGQQLTENPHASLLFHWAYLGRQIRMHGSVERTTREESEKYFHSRPRGAQLGASASAQSRPLDSREALDQLKQQLETEFRDQAVIPLPDHWGGFALIPERFEFWQGRLDRMHDRFRYSRSPISKVDSTDGAGVWDIVRLNP